MSLQKEAEKRFGVKAKIKTGGRGEMQVCVNGKNVFAYKKNEGRMPEISELLQRIEAAR